MRGSLWTRILMGVLALVLVAGSAAGTAPLASAEPDGGADTTQPAQTTAPAETTETTAPAEPEETGGGTIEEPTTAPVTPTASPAPTKAGRAGLVPFAAGDVISGVVLVDANKDGAKTSAAVGQDDRGLAGVTVNALDASGNVVGTTTTNASGEYSLTLAGDATQLQIVTADANGNVYATHTATSADNDFARSGAPNRAVATLAGGDQTLNALVYPTWKLDAQLANDPDGLGGKSILTGAPTFDADDSEDGNDSGTDNARVRSADIVSFNWSLSASTEDGSLGNKFADAVFEQTITLNGGALANFASIPAVCDSVKSSIVAQPGNVVLAAKADPPAGTTSVTLTCVLGEMGVAPAPSAILLGTQVQPSAKSPNGSSFDTDSRFYAVDANGAATAQPAAGPEVPPIEITSAPRYDVEKINGDAAGNYLGNYNGEAGTYSYYTVQISTDRKVGVEAFAQPITMQESFWALIPPPEGTNNQMTDLRWYLTRCDVTPAPRSGQTAAGLVYGKIGTGGGVATAANSVRDSGTCTIGARTAADTGSYTLSMNGIDTSGLTYPTTTLGGASLAAGPYYVASYRIQIFIPFTELDRTDGVVDGNGALSLYNRVGDFDPQSVSGASNFGTGVEPGYCDLGPTTDQATNCDLMEAGTRSNNVVGPHTKRISPGSWSKYFFDLTSGWRGGYGVLPDASVSHDGAGQVQPGQAFTSFQVLNNSGTLDMAGAQMCDVFDNTMLKLVPLNQDVSASTPFADGLYSAVIGANTGVSTWPVADSQADQSNWVFEYASIDFGTDDPNLGVYDAANDRWQGDWTNQKAATNSKCGDASVTWSTDPTAVAGGIDAVNAVRVSAKAGKVITTGQGVYWLLAMEQRDTYNGGPHAGESIPAGTVAANFGNMKSSTFNPNWRIADYIPGAGTTDGGAHIGESAIGSGDRWTVSRAQMRLQKRTVAGSVAGESSSGVADFGVTGSAVAGKPVIWEITSTLTAASQDPAPVNNVVITDTLPNHVIYNEAGTQALATAGGFPMPTSVTPNGDGTTTLVWNLGTRTPNQDLPLLKIATYTDSMAPPNTTAVNNAAITATGVTPVAAHRDDHTITIQQTGQVQLKKTVDKTLDLQNDNQQYLLEVRNFSETLAIQAPTIYEVLPYNGDANNAANVQRTPPSDYAGTSVLRAAPVATNWTGEARPGTFYYTTVASADVPQQQSDDDDASIWSTTFTAAATGFKFVASTPLTTTANAANSGIKITFQTDQDGNDPGDIYTNRFTAISQTLNSGNQLLTSNTVSVRVIGFSLGDLIWFDLNGDGKYDAGTDRLAPEGVKVEVRKADGTVVTTTTTLGGDQQGRWVVNDLSAGDYYVTIPASEFAAGGKLAGAVPALNPVADPNTDANEGVDHHAIADGAGVRSSGVIRLSADTAADPLAGQEPLGDNVAGLILSPLTTDDFTNLTLDLALIPPAKFKVIKEVDGDGAEDFGSGPFTIRVTCTFDNATVAGYPKTETFTAGQSKEFTAPLGSSCLATETGNGGATAVEIDPEDGLTLASEVDVDEITVTNTFELGRIRLYKDVAGAGLAAGLTKGKVYTFDLSCSFNGKANAVKKSVTITDDGTGQMFTEIEGIPVGAECTVTETDNGGADDTPPAETRVIVDSETTVWFCLENVFSAGTLLLTKEVAGDAKEDPFVLDREFQVEVTCELEKDGVRGVTYSATHWIKAGDEVALKTAAGADVLLPTGTHCWLEETETQGADDVALNYDGYDNAAIVRKLAKDAPLQVLELSATNRFDQAELLISKVVDGPDLGESYDFEVACTYPVTTPEGVMLEEYPLAETDARFSLKGGESKRITVLAGVSCEVVETNVPDRATVTIVDSDGSTEGGVTDGKVSELEGTENAVEVTNTLELAELTVSKTVVGPGTGKAYDFELACVYHGADGDVPYPLAEEDARFSLKDGESRTITVLAGVDCQVTETNVPGGATVTIVDSDASTEGGDADGALADLTGDENTVDVTNTFDKPVLPHTGAQSVGLLLALGAAAVLIGAGLVLNARRRRT